jgi:hypothetical protein
VIQTRATSLFANVGSRRPSGTLGRRRHLERLVRTSGVVETAALGIRYLHSSPYHPQTCGEVERLHQTLKRRGRAPASDAEALARQARAGGGDLGSLRGARRIRRAGAQAGAVGVLREHGRVVLAGLTGYQPTDEPYWNEFHLDDPLPMSDAIREQRVILVIHPSGTTTATPRRSSGATERSLRGVPAPAPARTRSAEGKQWRRTSTA